MVNRFGCDTTSQGGTFSWTLFELSSSATHRFGVYARPSYNRAEGGFLYWPRRDAGFPPEK